jgi:hypothetical protein
MVAYWSSDWVKGNAAAAANAPIRVTVRCSAVSAEILLTSPALAAAAKPKPAVMRKPMNCSSYSVPMP